MPRSLKQRGVTEFATQEVPVPLPGFPQLKIPFSSSVVQVFCIIVLIIEAAVFPQRHCFVVPSQRGA